MATTKKKSRRTGVSDATIERRVRRGARLLDQKVKNWHKRIDIDRINLRCSTDCILGQIFGWYFSGRTHLKLFEKTNSHGFSAAWSEGDHSNVRLRDAWIHAINRRIAKNKSRRRRSK